MKEQCHNFIHEKKSRISSTGYMLPCVKIWLVKTDNMAFLTPNNQILKLRFHFCYLKSKNLVKKDYYACNLNHKKFCLGNNPRAEITKKKTTENMSVSAKDVFVENQVKQQSPV